MAGTAMAILPYEKGGVGGALVAGEAFVPGSKGAIVYLNAGDDLDGALTRVEAAGGKVVLGKTHLSDAIGSIATSWTPRETGWPCIRRGRKPVSYAHAAG